MTQLVLILGINLAGLSFAIVVARWAILREPSTAEVRRLTKAVEHAARSFLAGCFRHVAWAIGLVAIGLAMLHLGGWQRDAAEIRSVVWSLSGLLMGGLLTCITTHFAVQLSQRAATQLIPALQTSTDRALAAAMRAGGSVGLLCECAYVLGVGCLFALLIALSGAQGAVALTGASYLLGGYALGVLLAALVIQRAGSVYHTASEVGGELGGERDADLAARDPRNPAAVAKLVGEHVGQVASRAVDLFACTSVASTAVLLVGIRTLDAKLGEGGLGLLLLPIVVKSFGVIASAFGIMVVRVDEKSDPAHGVWRGHVTTLVICLGALLGSTLWLMGHPGWAPFFVAGSLGLLVAAGSAYAALGRIRRRASPLRSIADALKTGDGSLLAEALAVGLRAALVPSILAAAALVAAWHVGEASTLQGGGMLAMSLALMTMLASGPFMLAAHTLGPLAGSARTISTLAAFDFGDAELLRRAQRLEEAGASSDVFAQTFWILAGGVGTLFAAGTLSTTSALPAAGTEPAPLSFPLAHPAVAYAGLVGAVLVLTCAGGVLRAANRSMRGVVSEVERQLRAFPRERGKFLVPLDYIPSYRACIEVVAQSALKRPLVPVLAAVLTPMAAGPLLMLSTAEGPQTAKAALASLVLAGAVTGITAAFAADAIKSCLSQVRRQARTKAAGEQGLHAGGFAELFGTAAGPAAQLAFKATAVGSLAVAPFLS